MNEAASSVEPEVKTRFATVDDARKNEYNFKILTNKISKLQ
jgi:hypothetical protein